MNPADHSFHRQLPPPKDCANLFSPTHCNNPSSGNSNFNLLNINNSNSHNISAGVGTNPTNTSGTMGGQTPVYFGPTSSFIVDGHIKPGCHDLHEAMLAKKQLLSRGPLQLVDFKEMVGVGGEGSGIGGGELTQLGKRTHIRFTSGNQEYDPGPASTRSSGEDQMSMEYMEHMEGGEYMDQLEGGVGELMKKASRRLGYDQVKALEKAFEVENRLEPERKVRLASQLGLQPRQVAVWFQNRRARWKTKQMERDYTLLKNKFEALKTDRDKLLQEKDHLQAELARLKGQVVMEGVQLMDKQAIKGDQQDSPTLASGSLVDDAAPASTAQPAMSEQLVPSVLLHHRVEGDQLEEEEEEGEEQEEEEASPNPSILHEQKLLQNDSLSSTEDSDINNDGSIVDSTCKVFQEETDYYAQHWRLPPAPTQILYKPMTIKMEEWQEQGENMGPFNMSLDTTWYNW